jgi:hypothetical protein
MVDVFQPLWLQSLYFINKFKFKNSNKLHATWSKARRTRAHLSRVLVIRDKLDRQNFLVCGQHLQHFRHS